MEMLSSSTHAANVALALLCVADIAQAKKSSHSIPSHGRLSLRLYHQAKHCWFRRCCFLLLVRLIRRVDRPRPIHARHRLKHRCILPFLFHTRKVFFWLS